MIPSENHPQFRVKANKAREVFRQTCEESKVLCFRGMMKNAAGRVSGREGVGGDAGRRVASEEVAVAIQVRQLEVREAGAVEIGKEPRWKSM